MPHHHIPSMPMPNMVPLSHSHSLAHALSHHHASFPPRAAAMPLSDSRLAGERYPIPDHALYAHHGHPNGAPPPPSYPLAASYAPSSADGDESDPSDGTLNPNP